MKINNTSDTMTSSSQVLEMLRQKKMDKEFRWSKFGFSAGTGKTYQPEDLMIIETFRFEGISNPSDMEIIYIIKAKDGTIGYSQDAYGVYTNHEDEEGYDNFIRRIPEAGHDEQLLFQL